MSSELQPIHRWDAQTDYPYWKHRRTTYHALKQNPPVKGLLGRAVERAVPSKWGHFQNKRKLGGNEKGENRRRDGIPLAKELSATA